jgi:hypothetical protein
MVSANIRDWLIVAACFSGPLAGFAAPQESREGNSPSQDEAYDKIVDDFIQFDIGRMRDPSGRIRARFQGLRTDDAIPALVRGLNRSTHLRASCPITAISEKLRNTVKASKDPEIGTYVLQNLDRNYAGPYRAHLAWVFDAAEKQVAQTMGAGLAEERFKKRAQDDLQRLAYVPGRKLSELTARESASPRSGIDPELAPSNATNARSRSTESEKPVSHPGIAEELGRLSGTELRNRLRERNSRDRVLGELSRRTRAGDGAVVTQGAEEIEDCLKDADESIRESAAWLLGQARVSAAVPALIDAMDDESTRVRSAAVTSLTRITRQLFGPSDDASKDEWKVAQTRWREWWGKQTKGSLR